MFANDEDDRRQESSGSGWVNLETMLGLNEQQGQEMASAVTDPAQKKLGDAQGALQQGQNKFKKDTQSAVQAGSAGVGTYSGPTSFGDSAPDVRSQVAAAKGAIQGLGTTGGNARALDERYGQKQNYSTGQRSLDSFLAGGKIDEKASGLKSSLADLEGQLGIAEHDADQQYVAAKQQYTSNLNDFYARQSAERAAEAKSAADLKDRQRQIMEFASELGYQGSDPIEARGWIINVERQRGQKFTHRNRYWDNTW